MKYRKFGKLDWESSVLGFGVMCLPTLNKESGNINESEIINMIRYGIDNGINYLDTGFAYDLNQYELLIRLIGRALEDGYRQKVKITSTIPSYFINSYQDFDRYINLQLEWMQIDMIDFYLIGRLYRENWPNFKDMGVLRWADSAMADGKFDKLGFTFHDHYQILKNILNDYDNWSLSQIQYSYMDVDHDPGTTGLKYTEDTGLAIIAAEPLKWRRLEENLPDSIKNIWERSSHERSLLEWGLRWVWNFKEVSTALIDFSSMEHLRQCLSLAEYPEPENLTISEEVLYSKVRGEYRKLKTIPCSSCRSCMPCPNGLDVPRIFEIFNDAFIYDNVDTAKRIYKMEKYNIEDCNECGICEKRCTKGLPIQEWLKKVHDLFNSGK